MHDWGISDMRSLSSLSIVACVSVLASHGVLADDSLYGIHSYANGNVSSDKTFGELEFIVPLAQGKNTLLFLDARGLIDSRENLEGSIGAGIRHIVNDRFIIGAYGFYDHRRTANDSNFDQATFGAELMSEKWDLRFNYYSAFDETRRLSSINTTVGQTTSFEGSDLFLSGNSLFANVTQVDTILTTRTYERANDGWDAEVGYEFFSGIRAFAGYFNFNDNQVGLKGPRGRLEWNVADNISALKGASITLTGEFSDDDTRGSLFSGGIRLSIPFGKSKASSTGRGLNKRMTEWVRRSTEVITSVADTARTSQQVTVTQEQVSDTVYRFIDNSAPEGGNGTFENPYNGFRTSDGTAFNPTEEGDVIFLYAGNDEYFGGIDLVNGQSLIGEADGLQAFGTFLIEPGERPTLEVTGFERPAEALITTRGNNLISGIHLSARRTFAGISGNLRPSDSLTINNVSIELDDNFVDDGMGGFSFGAGISLFSTGGDTDQSSLTTVNISNVTVTSPGVGIEFSTSGLTNSVELNISNSIINGRFDTVGTNFGTTGLTISSRSNVRLTLTGNLFRNHNTALQTDIIRAADLTVIAERNSFVGNAAVANFTGFPTTIQPDGIGLRNIDFGGGTLGSEGANRFIANSIGFSSLLPVSVSAAGNFWQGTPEDTTFDLFPGSNLDTSDLLEIDPEPVGFGACPNEQTLERDELQGELVCKTSN